MSFPRFGSHVLHMTATPDGQAVVSTYGESRIALFDPRSKRVFDWGSVWNKPQVQDLSVDYETFHKFPKKHFPVRRLRAPKPDFAWCPVFDRSGRDVGGKHYDRLLWYGEEQWEYEQDVRLCAIAYNHRKPDEIVKIRFGTPVVGGDASGHWAASTLGPDGKVYFTDRVRDVSGKKKRRYARLRLVVFSPPAELGPLRRVPKP